MIERSEIEAVNRELVAIGEQPVRNSITFTLPLCPPSVNSLWNMNFKANTAPSDRVRLKPECVAWKNGGWIEGVGHFNGVKSLIPRFKLASDSLVRVDRIYHYPFLQKTGNWKKSTGIWSWEKQEEIIAQGLLKSFIDQELVKFIERDSFNMDKLLFDAISEKLGIDPRGSDKRFKSGNMESVNSKVEKTVIVLTEIPCSEWSKRV